MLNRFFKTVFMSVIATASLANAQNSAIIFEETTTTTTRSVTVLKGGLEVGLGDVRVIRPHVRMSKGNVRIGSHVITSDNRSGVVTGIFVQENKIVIKDSYYGNRTWNLHQVAVTQGCIGAHCVGDMVITSDNRKGTFAGYFNDGRMVVTDSYYGNRTFAHSAVGMSVGCTELFCAGDRVITSDNRSGVVSGFFPDGRVIIQDSYYGNRTWRSEQIALTEAVCANIFIERVRSCGGRY